MATQQWQYRTVFLWADAERVQDYLRGFMTGDIPKYAPESLMPQLDALGDEGWELVHMQPVYVGKNADVLVHFGGVDRTWSNAYFCVFKRART